MNIDVICSLVTESEAALQIPIRVFGRHLFAFILNKHKEAHKLTHRDGEVDNFIRNFMFPKTVLSFYVLPNQV